MVNRINLLLQAKNITARQFAEEIGIQPSGMSHILLGRNNPSLDFVMKVVTRWPEININWLMFGKGEMFTGAPVNVPTPAPKPLPVAEETHDNPSHPNGDYDLFSQIDDQVASVAESTPAFAPVVRATDDISASAPAAARAMVPKVSAPAVAAEVAAPPSATMASPSQQQRSFDRAAVQDTPSSASEQVTQTTAKIEKPVQPAVEQAKPQLDENRVKEITNTPVPLQPILAKKKIEKVIVLYDDHSFSEYYPE